MNHVIAIIHEENGRYGISFPDFPGCVSGGRSLEEAMRRGREALRAHVESMIADGDPVPVSRAIHAIEADPEFRAEAEGAIVLARPLDLPGRPAQRRGWGSGAGRR